MSKFELSAVFVFLSVLFFVSACNQATGGNPSGGATTVATARLDKSPTPTPTPKNSGGNYEQALKDYDEKNFDKAAAGFKDVIAGNPKHGDAHFYLGKILFDKKEFETSLPHFEQAAKLDNKSVKKLMALGENQRVLKKFDVAVVQFQRVIGFDSKNADAYLGLGQTYVGLNNKIAARQQHRKLEELSKELADQLKKEIDAMK